MKTELEVLFTPAEFEPLAGRDLADTTCVVFDILRATTSMITALGNGAEAIVPVADIPEALRAAEQTPGALLAGERQGLKITAALTGSRDFDLGNSPREFTRDRVAGRTLIMTTTNGTRALRSCAHARRVLVGSFLNLAPIAGQLRADPPARLLVICSGTFEQAAYEDMLAAGALCDALWDGLGDTAADSALGVRELFRLERGDISKALGKARNGRRLLSRPELRDDVACCAQRDTHSFVATLVDGRVTRAG
jgi:2-phosphosulfolactate phosphatase